MLFPLTGVWVCINISDPCEVPLFWSTFANQKSPSPCVPGGGGVPGPKLDPSGAAKPEPCLPFNIDGGIGVYVQLPPP